VRRWPVTRASQVFVYYPKEGCRAEYCLEAGARLQDQALVLLLLLCQEGSSGGRFENFADTLVGLGRAFEVFVGTNLLAHFLTLWEQHVSRSNDCFDWNVTSVVLQRSRRTCSIVTGFCDVFANSSMVLGSCRRSFLQPTRMIGRPWQKWRTSEIHCGRACQNMYVPVH
jgi:hypothetical protein